MIDIDLELKKSFFVAVPVIATYTDAEIRAFGVPVTIVNGVALKKSYLELTRCRLPYIELIPIVKNGMDLGFPVEQDAVVAYKHSIMLLDYCKDRLSHGLNTIELPVDLQNDIEWFSEYLAESFNNLIREHYRTRSRFRNMNLIPTAVEKASASGKDNRNVVSSGRRTRFSAPVEDSAKQRHNHNSIYANMPKTNFK